MNEDVLLVLFSVILILTSLAAMFNLYRYYILYNPKYAHPFVPELGILIIYSSSVPGEIQANVSTYINNLTTLKIGYHSENGYKFYKIAYGVCIKHNLAKEVERDLLSAIANAALLKVPGGVFTRLAEGFAITAGEEYIKNHLIGKGSDADLAFEYSATTFEEEVYENMYSESMSNTKGRIDQIANILIILGSLPIPGSTILMGVGIALEATASLILWAWRSIDWWKRCYNDAQYEFVPGVTFNLYWNSYLLFCVKTNCSYYPKFEIYPFDATTQGKHVVRYLEFIKKDFPKAKIVIYPTIQKIK